MTKPVSILLTVGAGFLFGIWFGFIFRTGVSGVIFFLVVGLIWAVMLARARFLQKSRPGVYLFLFLFFISAFVGAIRLEFVREPSPELLSRVGQEITLNGFVSVEPDERDLSTRLTISLDGFPDKIIAVVSSASQVAYGDVIKLTGVLDEPENFSTDTGREFDYKNYLAKDGIFFIVYRPQIEILGENRGHFILRFLYGGKDKFLGKIEQVIPEPEMSLLAGLLFGEKQGLGGELNDAFQKVGLTHIIVLSGFNLAVVATAIFFFLGSFLSRRLAIIFSGIGIVLFALMVGGGATVFRATVMALIALLAKVLGRDYEASIALLVAGVVMLLVNPVSLFYDVGFQLSFIATLGLIYLSPIVDKIFYLVFDYLSNKPYLGRWIFIKTSGFSGDSGSSLWGIISVTLSAQIAVLPWLAYKMGQVSIISLVANALVLPLVPFVMLSGFLAGVFGVVSYFVSLPVAYVSWFVLRFMIVIAESLSAVPFATVLIGKFSIFVAGLVYVSYLVTIYFYNKKEHPTSSR